VRTTLVRPKGDDTCQQDNSSSVTLEKWSGRSAALSRDQALAGSIAPVRARFRLGKPKPAAGKEENIDGEADREATRELAGSASGCFD